MKTALNIDETIMAELKQEAARQGCTMSELMESALRLLLRSHLPTFHSGGTLVDIADRNCFVPGHVRQGTYLMGVGWLHDPFLGFTSSAQPSFSTRQ
jgi:hypothetical protein